MIRELELPIVLSFNRSRVMALAQGVSKATGSVRHWTSFARRLAIPSQSEMRRTITNCFDFQRLARRSSGAARRSKRQPIS